MVLNKINFLAVLRTHICRPVLVRIVSYDRFNETFAALIIPRKNSWNTKNMVRKKFVSKELRDNDKASLIRILSFARTSALIIWAVARFRD